jgi:lipoprotein-anchoring transpeptidase ErfK/SrfK
MPTSTTRTGSGRHRAWKLPASLFAILSLAGCVSTVHTGAIDPAAASRPAVPAPVAAMYGPVKDGDVTIPAVDVSKIDPRYLRQVVDYKTDQPPGTIVVDPYHRFLYLVMKNGKALRYGVGVAKAGLQFKGSATIARKAEWPHWTPTPDMIKRQPKLYEPLASGLDGGLKNPLGARALYLFRGGKDTLYRLHGTNQPWSIGHAVSSGCIRLLDQDIIDLYRRVPKGARVVVLGPDSTEQGES